MLTTVPIARPHIGDAEVHAAVRVLRSGHLAQGSEVAVFEDEFAALVDGRHCIAVSSGTAALHLSLLALGVGRGDEVIVPSFTFGATVHAVALTGATPVFADIDPATFCLNPASVAAAITARTAALLPVHLFGHPAPMDQLTPLAQRHGLAIIEDAAQAAGARLHSKPVGALGTVGCFSFYPTKNMHSIEGGMAVTADPAVAQRLRLLRNQGMNQRYQYEIVGLNARMTDVAAAVGRVQLRSLPRWIAARRANAAHLDTHLRGVQTPTVAVGAEHAYHQYTVRVTGDRDTLIRRAARHGVSTAVFYPTPIHRSPAYRQTLDLPHTDHATTQVLSLPVHPALTTADLTRIVTAVNPENTPLRAGLVGLGMMGRHHARILRRLEGVHLVGAADPCGDPHRQAEGLPVVDTVEQLLRHRLDYCVVAVPTAAHATIGHALAAAGVHALIEKPLASTLTEAVTLAEAFDAAGLVGAVGHTERYNPALLALRARLAVGELGTVYQMATRRQGPFPPRISNVGVVHDLATHDIDLVTWVTGRPVTSITARTAARSGRQHEDLLATIGELTDGTITSHLINWLSPMKERVTVATGERGCLLADTLHADLTYYANGCTTTEWAAAEVFRGVTEGDVTRYAIAKKEPLLTEHEAFRDTLLGRAADVVTLWQSAHTVAVAEAVLTSATSGQTVAPTIPRPRGLVDQVRRPAA